VRSRRKRGNRQGAEGRDGKCEEQSRREGINENEPSRRETPGELLMPSRLFLQFFSTHPRHQKILPLMGI
jgi:hypothetical protein